ncbi:hypothetical protein DENSPDRAFT_864070 [Dentipellis sp. KUC8613]|nr:hypothetical protein DENSPDRAFT_864070 [Dentipellis sp. KUC8613]
MTASFATYASQFLNRQRNPASSLSSSQPLFFSFSTDDDASRAGNNDSDLDDLDDPHLRASDVTASRALSSRHHADHDDDDPYLRLDEDDPNLFAGGSRAHFDPHSMPLIDSHAPSEGEPSRGWLAHQASPLRSPSPAPSSSSDSGTPPADLLNPALARTQRPHEHRPPPPPPASRSPPVPPPPRTAVSLSLTESLLPRDGRTRPLDVFSLPDPRHISRSRRKYNDSIWTAVWCTGLSLCVFFSILVLFLTRKPPKHQQSLPYTTFLHTVPMLIILTFVSAIVSYTHIALLRIFVRPVVFATSVFVPATLLISAIWAFVGSFMWDANTEPTWGETWGLRLFSLVPLALALLTARRLVHLPRDMHMASALLTQTTDLLAANPFLLALSPSVLLAVLIASIPFLTLIFRLLLIGYFLHPAGGWQWHVKGWANWAIVAAAGIWLWTWGVARGVLRVTTAGVIAAWYFADPDMAPPPPMSTHTIHAALTRAAQPSLGTIALSALILTGVRILTLLTILLRRAPLYLPPTARPLAYAAGVAAGYLEGAAGTLSAHALVYVGITGDPFWPAARRARALVAAVESKGVGSTVSARYRRRFKTEPPLTLLTIAPLTLTFPFALLTYLFVAHTLSAPAEALGAAFLAGGVTALVGLFCVGLVKDVADTLYLCYCIDKDVGERRRAEVFELFELDSHRTTAPSRTRPAPTPSNTRTAPAPTPSQPPPRPKPQQPISQRVEHLSSPSPESSPEPVPEPPLREIYTHHEEEAEDADLDADVDVDPFLHAFDQGEELEASVGPSLPASPPKRAVGVPASRGYDVGSGLASASASVSASARRARDEEEGMGMSGLFPGSDLF